MDGLDMIEILICKQIFRSCHLEKYYRLFGMVLQSLLEDLQLKKSIRKIINILLKRFLIKEKKLFSVLLETHKCQYAQQFVHIWVASLSHIWVHIMDGSAFATVQSMTNLAEFDKDLPYKTYHISTTQFMRVEQSYALKLLNSQESLHKLIGLDNE